MIKDKRDKAKLAYLIILLACEISFCKVTLLRRALAGSFKIKYCIYKVFRKLLQNYAIIANILNLHEVFPKLVNAQ